MPPADNELSHAHVAIFQILRDAAVAGYRCPITDELISRLEKLDIAGSTSAALHDLAAFGYITIRVFTHNWRTVEIMVGPHRGATTLAPPHRHSMPYMVRGKLPSRPFPAGEPIPPSGVTPKRRGPRELRKPPTVIHDHRHPVAVPVGGSSFIRPPTLAQLMGRR